MDATSGTLKEVLSHAQEVFMSDVHGEHGTFARLLACVPAGTPVHLVGDVYDRGPAPDLVMDEVAARPGLDIQWGNHDILWMGAAAGQPGCVANVVRICARYGNLDVLERTYGIDLGPLREFAARAYADDPCAAFGCKGSPDLPPDELRATVQVQKAMAYIQFKVEARIIAENPSFGLEARDLLARVDFQAGTVEVDGVVHALIDPVMPTVDPADPCRLTDDELAVIDHLVREFCGCERLQRHMQLFLDRGSLWRAAGDVLLFHACVPLEADGSLRQTTLYGRTLGGRPLFDAVDGYVRDAFRATEPDARKRGADLLWYLWLGPGSPLFAKSKMATFELYLVADKATRTEAKNAFYQLRDDPAVVRAMLAEFGAPEDGRIVCGHVPVKVKDGEDPVHAGGQVLCIDGGMSRPYQASTGIGGFVLARVDGRLLLGALAPADAEPSAPEVTWREV